jgi:hypothetical protein
MMSATRSNVSRVDDVIIASPTTALGIDDVRALLSLPTVTR